jgi:sugar-specific transcriptional regulator TrmB
VSQVPHRIGDPISSVAETRSARTAPALAAPSGRSSDLAEVEAPETSRSPRRLLQGLALFGLTAHEGQLYLALATGGPMNARDVTLAAGLQRATAYRVLLRLLHRGLVMSDGMWPQRFYALPFGTLYGRMQTFFSDEVELRQRLASCYGSIAGDSAIPRTPAAVEIVSSRGSGASTILRELARARRQLDVMIRLRSAPSGFRGEVARTLARAAGRGVRVRLLTDASAADRQFLEHLYKDFDPATHLEVRHYSPLVGHFYVLDASKVLRFSVLSGFGRATDVGMLCADADYARTQATRFEALWVEGVPADTAARTMRASGWLTPPGPAGPSPGR